MLDIKFIRQNPGTVREGARKKNIEVDTDKILELDRQKRECLQALEDMNAKKNEASKKIAGAKEDDKKAIIMQMKELDGNNDKLEEKMNAIDGELQNLLMQIPNLPLDSVPVGKDDSENVVEEQIGKKTEFDFIPKSYMDLGEALDIIDTKRAAKTSGSRFGFLKGNLALMEFAIINLVLEKLTKNGFIPVIPPVMLKPEIAKGMGFLEQGNDEDAYYLPKDDLFLAGTAEQPLGGMHSGEVFEEKDLPRRYVGFSTCFRREAGSYGKDTKGILRVHQFDKLEMFSYSKPEDSVKEHKLLLSMEKELMKELGVPFQVVHIASGDLGVPAAEKYDIEAWIPLENRYRETHSTSNCTDFQARRLNIRYRDKNGNFNFVHTLNGTAFAIGRILIAIMENYQQKDGSIEVPKALQKYLDFKSIK
ncbi:MAG: serine--tRNA ligase [Candidatus Paceibacterota bacterium]|jgi:seryl-tRNA synthetase